MPTKRLSSSAAKQGRLPVSALAITVAAALGTLAMPAFSADAKEDTITVVGGSNAAQQESAWGPVGTYAAKRSASGSKTDTPLVKTPQSISVVTREEMDMRQPTTVKEAFGYTPGVMVGSRGSSTTYDALSIRGFTEVNTNQYLNGIKLQGDNYSEAKIDPYFLERAELLRGPASVLYGKSSPGGVVSLVSKRPTTETLREIQFQMGTDNLFSTGFDFGGGLDDDGVYSYRLTGLARSADSQQDMAKEKRYAIAPSFSWRPDDRTNFTLLSYFQNEPDTGYYGWLPKQGTVLPYVDANGNQHKLPTNFNEGEADNKLSRNQKMIGYSFEHGFNDVWTVRQNLRYMQVNSDFRGVYGNGYLAPATITRAYVQSKEHLNNFDVDTQAQAKFNMAGVDHTLLMGVDYMRMRNDINSYYGSASNLNMQAPQYGNADVVLTFPYQMLNRQEQTGLYVQDQAEWERWVLTLGGRYDWATTSAYNRSNSSEVQKHDGQFTWRGGLNYVFDNGIAPYFAYSESFMPTPGTTVDGMPFDPSRAKQYEAGIKFIPKDRPITLSAAVYQLTKDKNLTANPDTNFPGTSVQSGEIRSRGVELEAKAAVNANINVTASYTYTDAEYTKDTTYQGSTPEQIPKNMASLWADYTFHETALSGLTLGSGVRYVGSTWGNTSNNFKVASYSVVDATVKYDLARFGLPGSSVGVNIKNLLDREYVESCYSDYACYWGTDRQVVATATFRF